MRATLVDEGASSETADRLSGVVAAATRAAGGLQILLAASQRVVRGIPGLGVVALADTVVMADARRPVTAART